MPLSFDVFILQQSLMLSGHNTYITVVKKFGITLF